MKINFKLFCFFSFMFISNFNYGQWTISNSNAILNTTGKIGVGTNVPDGKLDVRTNSGIGIYTESFGKTPSEAAIYARGKTKSVAVYAESNLNYGIYGFSFYSNGVVGNIIDRKNNYAGYFMGPVFSTASFTVSDRKLKTNIVEMQNALDYIHALKPMSYTFNTAKYPKMNLPTGQHFGLIADELESIFPTLVRENQTLDLDENAEKVQFKSVNYEELIPVLIKGMQEQSEIIKSLNERIAKLENKNSPSNDKASIKYIISPNPTNVDIKISKENGNLFEKSTIILTNVNGAILKKIEVAGGESELKIDVSNFAVGVYNCTIQSENEQVTNTFIIMK
ncbi:MAG: tail fiber domain-containing protein [Saprospiraceae bacterium]|nr:tail fiber domain-containing protein [Saprospiraceae bacterium]